MNDFKLNYKSKAKMNGWVIFNNLTMCFLAAVLFYSVFSLLLMVLFDYYEAILPIVGSIVLFILTSVILMAIYVRSPKSAELRDNHLIIHFGFYEFGRGGYANFNTKIDISTINSCSLETQYTSLKVSKFFLLKYDNKVYDETRIDLFAGDYNKPYLKVTYNDNMVLMLPVTNAGELCDEINKNI